MPDSTTQTTPSLTLVDEVKAVADSVAADAEAVLASGAAKVEAAVPAMSPIIAEAALAAGAEVTHIEAALLAEFKPLISGERSASTVEQVEAKAHDLLAALTAFVKKHLAAQA